jgi:thioredoxin reductase (NADPH)
LRKVKTNAIQHFPVNGVFIFIGYIPNSQLFEGQIKLNKAGYVEANDKMQTSVEGVFVAGDIHDSIYRQVSTSCGSGTIAAIEAEKYIAKLEGREYPGK